MFEECSEVDTYTKPPLTEKTLSAFEELHGIRIPKSLRDALLKQNGGSFLVQDFMIDNTILSFTGFTGIPNGENFGLGPLSEIDLGDDDSQEKIGKLAGDTSKLFCFESDGHNFTVLNWNTGTIDNPSVWTVNSEYKVECIQYAESWDGFLALQYRGEAESSIVYGSGWEGFTILLNEEVKLKNESRKNILGCKGARLRCQSEATSPYHITRNETEAKLSPAKINLGFEDSRHAKLYISGYLTEPGQHRTSEYHIEQKIWKNEGCGKSVVGAHINVCSRSLDTLATAFDVLALAQEASK